MVNIYDDINKLVLNFRKMDEFKKLEKAVETVRANEEATKYFTNFRDIQIKLQQKQIAGEEITEEELAYVQKAAQLAQSQPVILEMLEAEMALSTVIEEVNRLMFQPIQSLYEGL